MKTFLSRLAVLSVIVAVNALPAQAQVRRAAQIGDVPQQAVAIPDSTSISASFALFRHPRSVPQPFLPIPLAAQRSGQARAKRGIVGGVLGAVAGVGVCTLISVSFFAGSGCTTKGNTMFAVGGFAVGFSIGILY